MCNYKWLIYISLSFLCVYINKIIFHAFTIGGSVLTLDVSENSSLWTEESLTTLDEENLSNLPLSLELEAISEELANKGPIQTEVQLRYSEYC